MTPVLKRLTSAKNVSDVNSVLCDTLAKIANQETKIKLLTQENEYLKKELNELKYDVLENSQLTDNSILELQGKISQLGSQSQLHVLSNKVENLEGRSRRNNLRFVGIPEGVEKNEESVEIFIKNFIVNNMGVSLQPGAIERAHRAGPKVPRRLMIPLVLE